MRKTVHKNHKITWVFLIMLVAICISSFNASSNIMSPSDKDLWNYKAWTKVNLTPMKINDIIAQMCAPNIPIYKSKEKNPHSDKFITVYVNDLGKSAMFSKTPSFAIGSTIIKEKLPSLKAKAELLTVMIKREKGFNPESGDWEYLVLDPVKTSILERGKLQRCQECHLEKKDSDFIFRTYYVSKNFK